jgi:hypothetical protein
MTLNKDSAGDQLLLRMSMQMLPCSDICWRKALMSKCASGWRAWTNVHVIYAGIRVSIMISHLKQPNLHVTYRVLNDTLGAENLKEIKALSRRPRRNEEQINIRVISRKDYFKIKHTTLVHASFRTRYASLPQKQIVLRRCEDDRTEVLLLEVRDFAMDSLERHLELR